jgi:WD40 repeat protein
MIRRHDATGAGHALSTADPDRRDDGRGGGGAEPPDGDQTLNLVLAEYLREVEAGRPIDRDRLLSRYPQFAADLADFFADEERLARAMPSPLLANGSCDVAGSSGVAHGPSGLPGASRLGLLDDTQVPSDRDGRPTSECGDASATAHRAFADYELLEEVGRGGMGAVFRARHMRLNRRVALKMILTGQFASAEEVRRFQIEARNAAQLDHPNIVPIYEVGTWRGRHYFAMKLVDGGSLAGRVGQFTKDPRAAARLMAATARAVHYAHQRGVLHRDLKPANVLLDADGQPQITDFGLAKRLSPDGSAAAAGAAGLTGMTLSGAVLGTPRYMAPEQARGEKSLTVAADVYGVGAILYELLTGRPPFQADTVFDMLRQVREQDPPRPSSIIARIDRELETICLKCLEKDPPRRYASAEALAEDLDRWLAGEPIQARPVTSWHRAVKWARRKPAIAALIAVSVTAAAAVIVELSIANARIRAQQVQTDIARQEAVATAGRLKVEQDQTKQLLQRERQALADRTAAQQGAERASDAQRWTTYIRGIGLAEQQWRTDNVSVADRLLDACQPESLRGFEWYYLKGQCHQAGLLHFSGELIPGQRFGSAAEGESHVGAPVALVRGDHEARLLDAETGRELLQFPVEKVSTCKVACSPARGVVAVLYDGFSLGTAGRRPRLEIWNAATGQKNFSLTIPDLHTVDKIALVADGALLVSTGTLHRQTGGNSWTSVAGEVRVFSTSTGAEIVKHPYPVGQLTFSPDGKRLAKVAKLGIEVFDASTGELITTLKGEVGNVTSLVFSPDGRQIASSNTDAKLNVRTWDVETGRELRTFYGNRKVTCLAFSPDGQRLAAAGGETVRVWDAGTRRETSLLRQMGELAAVAFSADGTRIMAGGARGLDVAPACTAWPADGGREYVPLAGHGRETWAIAVDPASARIASASSDGTVKIWDADERHALMTLPAKGGEVYAVAFSHDGRWLASGSRDGRVQLWNARTGEAVRDFAGHKNGTFVVAFSPDGLRLASSGWDRTPRVWDVVTGRELVAFQGHGKANGWIAALAFSPDGERIATGGQERIVRIWDSHTGAEVHQVGRLTGCVSLAFSPDGKTLAGNVGRAIMRWNTETWEELPALESYAAHTQGSIAFTLDGRRLAAGGSGGAIEVWDTVTGQLVLSCPVATRGLAFGADGKRLMAAVGSVVAVFDGSQLVVANSSLSPAPLAVNRR